MQHRRRSGLIIGVLILAGLVGAALTAPPAQAASGVGPYYAEPAWDRKLPADQRFLVLTNWNSEAVLDKETGLVWERSPASTTHTWVEARSQCTSRTTGNRKGWRLPTIDELASLIGPSVPVDPLHPSPKLPPGHPFLVGRGLGFWSATTTADDPTRAWLVSFFSGDEIDFPKTDLRAAWCARGGNNADQY